LGVGVDVDGAVDGAVDGDEALAQTTTTAMTLSETET